jgi:hypothetical protein
VIRRPAVLAGLLCAAFRARSAFVLGASVGKLCDGNAAVHPTTLRGLRSRSRGILGLRDDADKSVGWRDSGLMMTLHGKNAVNDAGRHIPAHAAPMVGKEKKFWSSLSDEHNLIGLTNDQWPEKPLRRG